MNLIDAVRRLGVCLDKKVPYVKCEGGHLTSYSGNHWMSVEVPIEWDFCVRHDLLAAALSDLNWVIESDDMHGVIVRGKRAKRVRIHGVPLVLVPDPVHTDVLVHLGLPETLREILSALNAFINDEGAYWMQAVHLTRSGLLACNREELVRYDMPLDIPHTISLPVWLVKSIIDSKTTAARRLYERHGTIEIRFDDDTRIYSLKLAEGIPRKVVRLIEAIKPPASLVPVQLLEGVRDLMKFKARDALIGEDKIATVPEENDKLEVDARDVGVPGKVRKWRLDHLVRALTWAETIDLSNGDNATWSGAGYVGAFSERHL